jgi:spermidine synthase
MPSLAVTSSNTAPDRFPIPLAVFGLGVSAVMTQLALMREMLGVCAGNEMVIGIILGQWLLLTGAGTWLGRRADRLRHLERWLVGAQMLVALLPPAQVMGLRVLRNVVFLRGAAVGVMETVLSSLVLLAPYGLISGAMLMLACALLARNDGAAGVGRVYVADTLGSIAGGAVFSLVLVRFLDHVALLWIPAVMNLVLAGCAAWLFRFRVLSVGVALLTTGVLVIAGRFDADGFSTARQFAGQNVVFRTNSPYGRLVVTEAAGEFTFFANGQPMLSTHNTEHIEETVHYAMAQRPGAASVLLVGGGVSGTVGEIARHDPLEVTYVELDPAILDAGRRFLGGRLSGWRLRVVNTDGRRFIRQTGDRFDVVIVDAPDPSNSQLNRPYTAEFFAEVKRILTPNGVLSFGLGHYENYVSPELARMLSSAHRAVAQSFTNVLLIPGGRVFFLASDGPLDLDIAARLERRGIATRFVNRHSLEAILASDRLADLRRAVTQRAEMNRDFNPVLYYYHLRHWVSQFPVRSAMLQGVLGLLLGVYLVRLRAVPLAVFASGFAASALELVLLLAFQIFCGSLYQQAGLIVTTFMVGLALGAWVVNRWPTARTNRRSLSALAFSLALLAALLPFMLEVLNRFGGTASVSLAQIAVPLLTLLLATLVGMEFPLANRLVAGGTIVTASRLYTADFVGASLGALLASTLLIPLLGVMTVCLLTAALNVAASAAVLLGKTGA